VSDDEAMRSLRNTGAESLVPKAESVLSPNLESVESALSQFSEPNVTCLVVSSTELLTPLYPMRAGLPIRYDARRRSQMPWRKSYNAQAW